MGASSAVGIISTGRALPVSRITNFDLEEIIDTSDEWIRARTGIEERRIITGEETNSELSVRASLIALERANLRPEDLDLIIVATVTPDLPLPSTACLVQARLNARNAAAFDLAAGCTGFLYGLRTARLKTFCSLESTLSPLLLTGRIEIHAFFLVTVPGRWCWEKCRATAGYWQARCFQMEPKRDCCISPPAARVVRLRSGP